MQVVLNLLNEKKNVNGKFDKYGFTYIRQNSILELITVFIYLLNLQYNDVLILLCFFSSNVFFFWIKCTSLSHNYTIIWYFVH